jgi:lysophospholipase L1-like esterase
MTQTICIFGDSIVRGHADYQNGGWAQQLQKYGSAHELFSVYPLGISGDSTDDVIKRCAVELRAREARMVIYAVGINDAARWNGVLRTEKDQFAQNLDMLHSIAHGDGCEVVFVGLTPVDENLSTPVAWYDTLHYHNADINTYDDLIRKMCDEKECVYISMNDLISKDDLADGVHPNTHGHTKMYEKIKEILVKN